VRALFVAHNFPRHAGDLPGNFLLTFARALVEENVEVRVVAPHAADIPLSDTVEGIPVVRFRYAPDERETLAYTGTMASQVRASNRAKLDLVAFIRSASRAVRAEAGWADVVHAHWWFPSGLATTRSALQGRPLVTTLHGSDVRFARSALPRLLMRSVLKRSARVTAVSSWLATEAARRAGVALPTVAQIPVPSELFAPGNVQRGGILFVGKLDEQKGTAVLLDAMALLPKTVTATIVGDGPDAQTLHARAATLGISGRVHWMGAVPHKDLTPFYQRAALFVAPATDAEGLGLAAVEAQLCETPVVASNVGGLPEVVADRISGLLVPPGEPIALASAISDALDDPTRLAAWGREGRARVLARFDATACARQYKSIYEEVVRERARA
jgi:glycosyltransferase involved in cell wall biosynthesis